MRRPHAAITLVLVILFRPAHAEPIDWQQVAEEAISKLQGYLRVDTSNPPGNETPAAELLRSWLAAERIDAQLYDVMTDPARQALVARIPGRSGKTIVLMSHSDVVPAIAREWKHPPFAADIADDTLYARGALDTKELGILQIMTMLVLHRQGITPADSILLVIEPDEEEGARGVSGMLERHSELFSDVRMVLNEGGSGLTGVFKPGQTVFFVQTAEKGVAWMKLTAHGDAGHGSVPLPHNAVATMARALDRIAAYETPLHPAPPVVRLFAQLADQESFPNSWVMRHVDNPVVQTLFHRQLTQRPMVSALLRTTISLTGMQGGYKVNVIPASVEATLDCRINVGDSGEAVKHKLESVIADPQVTIELIQNTAPNESPIDKDLLSAIRESIDRHAPGSLVAPLMSSGVTDSAPFRRRGIPAYGFNTVVVTEAEFASVHGIDERIRLEEFRRALPMYYEVLTRLTGAGTTAAVGATPAQ